jgi:glyoxylase-like metal-dependent hydrolase (beta-lactamase superfamily II)
LIPLILNKLEILSAADENFGENSYLLREYGNIYIIDPGFNSAELKRMISGFDGRVKAIFLTHGHYDHIASIADFPDIIIYAHSEEKKLLADPDLNLSSFTGEKIRATNVTFYSGDRNELEGFGIYHTPGHTQGSVVITRENCIFSGDTLFEDSVGRSDLPTGDGVKLKETLKIFKSFHPDSMVYPGHGMPFSLKEAFQYNFFLRNIK